ncbi:MULTISPECIES: glycosyltransferase family 4 protein [unclassified Paenibacillus]|uniref:glycosyltransferase family 4 protein n=1 Tax=unclassified Paenibacillus TaxID=185978 RepID=UPI00277F75B4|nr:MULTISPECIES: glycosyltransferase family 4 protein [unclassified Paenibacillus]MDQ0901561.1 glycosyltransferase involved in cell wall biosynthesis [Paenibacillus sp. V4I7]MDQ0919937.1 glycosyltransferase involved in cell wall biosynthesis [Paenibacillus sp. V4I5]
MQMNTVMLFSHVCCLTYITGAEKYLLQLSREFGRYFRCILVVPNEGVLAKKARASGISVIVQEFQRTASLWRPHAGILDEMQQLIQSGLPVLVNLLHVHNPQLVVTNTSVNPLPAIAAKKLGIPTTWVITEVIGQNPYTHHSIQVIERNSDWIVGISEAVLAPFGGRADGSKRFLLKPTWLPEELQPGTWLHWREQRRVLLGIRPHQKLIGYISSDIVPHKGLEHFVQMGLKLCKQMNDVHFLITGNQTYTDYFSRCMLQIRQSAFSDRFHISGFEGNIYTLYPALDVLVVPSLIAEGFGLTAMEGLIFGKPIVAYRSGGLSEILTEVGEEALLAAPGDIDDLTAKTKVALLQEANGKTEERRRSKASLHFGMERYRSKLLPLIEKIEEKVVAVIRQHEAVNNKIPDGMLVKGSSPAVFLLEDGMKRPFMNGESFYFYRFKWEQVLVLEDMILNLYPTGRGINQVGHFIPNAPSHLLVKGTSSGIYMWNAQKLRSIATHSIFDRLKFNINDVVSIPDTLIHALPKGEPIDDQTLARGEVVHGRVYRTPNRDLYYGEKGQLRKIESTYIFQYMKWNSEKVVHINPREFAACLLGKPILYEGGIK